MTARVVRLAVFAALVLVAPPRAGADAPAPRSYEPVLREMFVSQRPWPTLTIRGAAPELHLNCSDVDRQVVICWKKAPEHLLASARRLGGAASESCLVRWVGNDGTRVEEHWSVDRDSGLLVSRHPREWYARTRGLEKWGFECPALKLTSNGNEYSPSRLDFAVEVTASDTSLGSPAHPFKPDADSTSGGRREPGQRPGMVLPETIERVRPRYPEEARQHDIEGVVLLHVLIGADGSVRKVVVWRSIVGLDEAAHEAIRRWRFRPAQVAGQPLDTWVSLPVRFTLKDE